MMGDAANAGGDRPLLEVHDLAVSFDAGDGARTNAVDGVWFSIMPGQTVALVGESGCGKSMTALGLLGLVPRPAGRVERGRALFDDGERVRDLRTLDEREMRRVRGGQIAMIFQEPMTSLNPVFTVGDQIVEAVRLHQRVGRREARDVAAAALRDVGISDPGERLRAYPHEFSGGMRQRVMIAMALACRPRLLLADEPTTALDVTIQAQILELLREMQRARGMGVLFITHALGVVAENADAVCVMYGGRIVECAGVYDLFDEPLHPYTRALLACSPGVHDRRSRLTTVREIVDDPAQFVPIRGDPNGARPWWPRHDPPLESRLEGGVVPAYALHEVRPGRWLGVWRTPTLPEAPASSPRLTYRTFGTHSSRTCP